MSDASTSKGCEEEVTLLSIKAEECYRKRRELLDIKNEEDDRTHIETMNDIIKLKERNCLFLDTIIKKKSSLSERKHTLRTILENTDKQDAASISLPYNSHEALLSIIEDSLAIVNGIQEVRECFIKIKNLNMDPICDELAQKVNQFKYDLAAQQVVQSQIKEVEKKINHLTGINRNWDNSKEDSVDSVSDDEEKDE